jgi:glutamyl-tRNA synthetase
MHIPLILGTDKKPLSKRNGVSAISYFIKEGYLPEALMNYLSSLGWGIEEEIYNFKEKIESFNPSKISSTPAIFDMKKMDWINQQHIRNLEDEKLYFYFMKWAKENSIEIEKPKDYVIKVLKITKEKITKLSDIMSLSRFMFENEVEYEEKTYKFLKNKDVFFKVLENIDKIEWTIEEIEKMLRKIQAETEIGKKKFFQSVRAALSGKLVTPGLFDVIWALGKDETKRRLKLAIENTDKVIGD